MAAAVTAEAKNGHQLITFDELSQLPPPHEDVALPEMGGVEVRLYAISGTERARIGGLASASGDDPQSDMDFTCAVISATLPGSTPEQIAALPATVIRRLSRVAFRLAGQGEQAIAAAVEALKATPNADSGSA
jgi:hypothetical protein